MRFVYADPPYIGQAKKHYKADPNCAEVDHAALIGELVRGYDGWALSCKSDAAELEWLLKQCRRAHRRIGRKDKVRLGAWFKPFCSYKPGVPVAFAWEPVIFWSSRRRTREQDTVRDWVE